MFKAKPPPFIPPLHMVNPDLLQIRYGLRSKAATAHDRGGNARGKRGTAHLGSFGDSALPMRDHGDLRAQGTCDSGENLRKLFVTPVPKQQLLAQKQVYVLPVNLIPVPKSQLREHARDSGENLWKPFVPPVPKQQLLAQKLLPVNLIPVPKSSLRSQTRSRSPANKRSQTTPELAFVPKIRVDTASGTSFESEVQLQVQAAKIKGDIEHSPGIKVAEDEVWERMFDDSTGQDVNRVGESGREYDSPQKLMS